jgi:hypothetical protein
MKVRLEDSDSAMIMMSTGTVCCADYSVRSIVSVLQLSCNHDLQIEHVIHTYIHTNTYAHTNSTY